LAPLSVLSFLSRTVNPFSLLSCPESWKASSFSLLFSLTLQNTLFQPWLLCSRHAELASPHPPRVHSKTFVLFARRNTDAPLFCRPFWFHQVLLPPPLSLESPFESQNIFLVFHDKSILPQRFQPPFLIPVRGPPSYPLFLPPIGGFPLSPRLTFFPPSRSTRFWSYPSCFVSFSNAHPPPLHHRLLFLALGQEHSLVCKTKPLFCRE